MDLKDYISSGVLEDFVLGLLSEKESSEVVNMMQLHPEVADYVRSFEQTLERYSQLHAVEPPSELKTAIMDGIRAQATQHNEQNQVIGSSISEPKAVNVSFWRKLAVAGIVLLIGSIALNIYLGSKNATNNTALQNLSERNRQLVTDSLTAMRRLNQAENQIALLSDPNLRSVTMNGVHEHSGIKALVYWNTNDKTVYLGKSDLPDAPAGKVYQLWAIIDGKPVDLGLYSPKDNKPLPVQMKKTQQGTVQAFAITLEKQGGSPAPTMDQMYVMGPVS